MSDGVSQAEQLFFESGWCADLTDSEPNRAPGGPRQCSRPNFRGLVSCLGRYWRLLTWQHFLSQWNWARHASRASEWGEPEHACSHTPIRGISQ